MKPVVLVLVLVLGCGARSSTSTSTINGALHITGAPPLDRELVAEAEKYRSVVETRVLDFDPARGMLVEQGGELELVAHAGEPPRALAPGYAVAWARFAGAEQIAFTADRDGDEDDRLYLIDRGKIRRLTSVRTSSPVARDGFVAWAERSRDGKQSAIETPEREVFARDGIWEPLDISADHRVLLVRAGAPQRSSLWTLELATGKLTPISFWPRWNRKKDLVWTAAAFARDDVIYALGNGSGDHATVWRFQPEGPHQVSPDSEWDVTELAVDRASDAAAFVDASERVMVYDHAATEARVVVANDSAIDHLAFAGGRLAFSASDPRHPRDAYLLDDPPARWAAGSGPDPVRLVAPKPIAIATFDHRELEAFLYRPARVRGVVVELHGGPEDRFRKRYAPFAQFLASRDYAVVQPNVRGSSGYGTAFAALDNGALRGDAVRDVGAVLDRIAADFPGIPVAVVGTSYGGFLALASLEQYADRLRAGVAISPITDLPAFLAHTAAYRRDDRRAEYGDERDPATRAFLASISPRADRIRAPLLVAHGRRDPRVPVAETEQFVRAVRDPVWLALADDEGHGFSRIANLTVVDALVIQLLASIDLHRSPR